LRRPIGIGGETPVDLDELDLISIDPLPSYVWYEDMADFAEQIPHSRPTTNWAGKTAGDTHRSP
jgi:hypothetical protein